MLLGLSIDKLLSTHPIIPSVAHGQRTGIVSFARKLENPVILVPSPYALIDGLYECLELHPCTLDFVRKHNLTFTVLIRVNIYSKFLVVGRALGQRLRGLFITQVFISCIVPDQLYEQRFCGTKLMVWLPFDDF